MIQRPNSTKHPVRVIPPETLSKHLKKHSSPHPEFSKRNLGTRDPVDEVVVQQLTPYRAADRPIS